jgi:NAD(P)H dehydrogenase (quinone)
MADVLVSFDVGMSQGKLGPATSAVAELTGQAPTSVAAYLDAHREALAQRDLQPV